MKLSISVLLIEFALLSAVHMLFSDGIPEALYSLLIFVFVLSYLFDVQNNIYTRDIRTAFVLGLLLRLVLMFWDVYCSNIYTLPNSGADALTFYYGSVSYATYGGTSKHFFCEVMGTIYKFIGCSRVYGQFIIVLFSVVSLHMANRAMIEFDISFVARKRAMMILCLLPNLAILSSIFLRESIVAMFSSISIYLFIKWMHGESNIYYVLSFVSVFLGSRFHSGVVGLAVGYIVVLAFYNKKRNKMNMSWGRIFAVILFVFIFVFLFNNYDSELFGKMQNVETISDVANTNDAGGSSYAQYVGNSNSIVSMVIFTPLRIIYFLFSPFPWQWRGIADIIAFIFSGCFYLMALLSGIKAIRVHGNYRNVLIVLFILAACSVFVFAWGVSNTGTATRHRDKLTVLYAVMYAVSYHEILGRKYMELGEKSYVKRRRSHL